MGFYNVENLFDTIDDPRKNDNAFLPDSKKAWNTYRYFEKIDRLAEVIERMNEWGNLIFIGFCEVENHAVLQDLSWSSRISKSKYSIIHRSSPDSRGIDVAAFYDARRFELLDTLFIRVSDHDDENFKTRDIVYVKGVIEADTLNIFLNHWPSRYGGQERSEPKRIVAAEVLRHAVDSLKSLNPKSKILVMGDFNDYPFNKSIRNHLLAVHPDSLNQEQELINLAYPLSTEGLGTYFYKGEWGMLDQVMVSRALYPQTKGGEMHIFNPDFITHERRDGEKVPSRSYLGNKYAGGYSDHFPIFIELKK